MINSSVHVDQLEGCKHKDYKQRKYNAGIQILYEDKG